MKKIIDETIEAVSERIKSDCKGPCINAELVKALADLVRVRSNLDTKKDSSIIAGRDSLETTEEAAEDKRVKVVKQYAVPNGTLAIALEAEYNSQQDIIETFHDYADKTRSFYFNASKEIGSKILKGQELVDSNLIQ